MKGECVTTHARCCFRALMPVNRLNQADYSILTLIFLGMTSKSIKCIISSISKTCKSLIRSMARLRTLWMRKKRRGPYKSRINEDFLTISLVCLVQRGYYRRAQRRTDSVRFEWRWLMDFKWLQKAEEHLSIQKCKLQFFFKNQINSNRLKNCRFELSLCVCKNMNGVLFSHQFFLAGLTKSNRKFPVAVHWVYRIDAA